MGNQLSRDSCLGLAHLPLQLRAAGPRTRHSGPNETGAATDPLAGCTMAGKSEVRPRGRGLRCRPLSVCARAPHVQSRSSHRWDSLVEEKLRQRRAAFVDEVSSCSGLSGPRSSLPCKNRGIERNVKRRETGELVILLEGSMQRGRMLRFCL